MEITRNIATLKLSAEEYKTLANALYIILKVDHELSEEEYLSDSDLSEISRFDIGTCYEVLNFFVKSGKTDLNTEEKLFYIEKEE